MRDVLASAGQAFTVEAFTVVLIYVLVLLVTP